MYLPMPPSWLEVTSPVLNPETAGPLSSVICLPRETSNKQAMTASSNKLYVLVSKYHMSRTESVRDRDLGYIEDDPHPHHLPPLSTKITCPG